MTVAIHPDVIPDTPSAHPWFDHTERLRAERQATARAFTIYLRGILNMYHVPYGDRRRMGLLREMPEDGWWVLLRECLRNRKREVHQSGKHLKRRKYSRQ